MTDRTCSVDVCSRPVLARGWCSGHYDRWARGGDLASPIRERPSKCLVDGCDERHYAHNWCSKHYQRWRLYGTPELPVSVVALCDVDGCVASTLAAGMCPKHYQRWKKHGDPSVVVAQCLVCSHPSRVSIEALFVGGRTTLRAIGEEFGIPLHSVARHGRNHLGAGSTYRGCGICAHPDLEAIDAALAAIRKRGDLSAIARSFDVSLSVLRRHRSPEHTKRRVTVEAKRLAAVREWVSA